MAQPFHTRYGPLSSNPEITIREEAPRELRLRILALADTYGAKLSAMASRIGVLLEVNPSDLTGLRSERFSEATDRIFETFMECDWPLAYAAIEEIHEEISQSNPRSTRAQRADKFSLAVNEYFRRHGIGWQFIDGRIEHRSDEAFEDAFTSAVALAGEAGLSRAQNELREARGALSRRPDPDPTGAISRATNALESVARSVTGESDENWGNIVRKHPDLLPEPMIEAVRSIREFAQENARHIREDKVPTFEDAELVVHVSAAATTYLVRKSGLIDGDIP